MSLIALFSYAARPSKEDTVRLTAHLKAVRGPNLSTPAYERLRAEYLDWIDTRVLANKTIKAINEELRAAGLFPNASSVTDEMFKDFAVYLEPVGTANVRGTTDILVITAGIYRGSNCSLDTSATLYQREPLKRLGYISASPERSDYSYYLSGLDIGEQDATGRRLVASGWVISSCTSTWNGKRIRADILNGVSVENVLAESVEGQDRDAHENVAAWVRQNLVTFWYQGGVGDSELLSGPSVARYRIVGSNAIRETPLALTRAGFLREWLKLSDADALRWSEPEVVEKRKGAALAIEKHGFEWVRIAHCTGLPAVWEIAVKPNDSQKLYVFGIGGSRATELRMESISSKYTHSCLEEKMTNGMTSVGSELPW